MAKKEAVKKLPATKKARKSKSSMDENIESLSGVIADTDVNPVNPLSIEAPGKEDRDYTFSILDDDSGSVLSAVKKQMYDSFEKKKNKKTTFANLEVDRTKYIRVKNLFLQYAIANYGLPCGRMMDIIAKDSCGKSTLLWQFIGWGIQCGCPGHVIECENKPLRTDHVQRIFSSNPALGKKMLKVGATMDTARDVNEMWEKVEAYVEAMRKVVPLSTPLIVGVDPFSKLMNPTEAAGRYDYGDNMSKDGKSVKAKDVGAQKIGGHASWGHGWMRILGDFLERHNVFLICTHHQNEKIDTSGFGRAGGDAGTLYNKVRTGGNPFDQKASIQLILARQKLLTNSAGEKIGEIIKMRVEKNSGGAKSREIEFYIKNDHYNDSEDYLEPPLQFDRPMSEWLVRQKAFGLSVSSRKFSSKELGLVNASPEEVVRRIEQPDVINKYAAMFNIKGYTMEIDNVIKSIEELPEGDAVEESEFDETDEEEEEVCEEDI